MQWMTLGLDLGSTMAKRSLELVRTENTLTILGSLPAKQKTLSDHLGCILTLAVLTSILIPEIVAGSAENGQSTKNGHKNTEKNSNKFKPSPMLMRVSGSQRDTHMVKIAGVLKGGSSFILQLS